LGDCNLHRANCFSGENETRSKENRSTGRQRIQRGYGNPVKSELISKCKGLTWTDETWQLKQAGCHFLSRLSRNSLETGFPHPAQQDEKSLVKSSWQYALIQFRELIYGVDFRKEGEEREEKKNKKKPFWSFSMNPGPKTLLQAAHLRCSGCHVVFKAKVILPVISSPLKR